MAILRPPEGDELADLSALCLRSKAYWGYDTAFLAACVDELTLTKQDLQSDPIIVLEDQLGLAGVAQLSLDTDGCFLEKLFVDTDRIGRGYGKRLFDWAVDTARARGAHQFIIEADPGAAPFYRHMGCVRAGEALSGSVAGRALPRFVYTL
ncbi:MAG: GNAT family N-acetyltransferase [Pseudomonadota bacterium]